MLPFLKAAPCLPSHPFNALLLLPTFVLLSTYLVTVVDATTTLHFFAHTSCNAGTDTGGAIVFDLNSAEAAKQCRRPPSGVVAVYVDGVDEGCSVNAYLDPDCGSVNSPAVGALGVGTCFFLSGTAVIGSFDARCAGFGMDVNSNMNNINASASTGTSLPPSPSPPSASASAQPAMLLSTSTTVITVTPPSTTGSSAGAAVNISTATAGDGSMGMTGAGGPGSGVVDGIIGNVTMTAMDTGMNVGLLPPPTTGTAVSKTARSGLQSSTPTSGAGAGAGAKGLVAKALMALGGVEAFWSVL